MGELVRLLTGEAVGPHSISPGGVLQHQLAVKCADNAIVYQLHGPPSNLPGSRMKMASFHFSAAFNSVQPLPLGEKLEAGMVSLITA